MRTVVVVLSTLALVAMLALPSMAVDIPSEVTLFKNVNIFDGQSETLLTGYDVLVVKNLIKKIDKDIEITDNYGIDVKTGGYKEVGGGGHAHDIQGYGDKIVVVYKPEKMVKKEVKVKVKVLFDPALAAKQGKFLAKMKKWYTPYEELKMATYENAQLLKLSGPRDPTPANSA